MSDYQFIEYASKEIRKRTWEFVSQDLEIVILM